jgi:Domain of unknown function (DUF4386)
MSNAKVRQDGVRIGAFAMLLFGILLVLQMLSYRIAGANVYGEDFAATLIQIADHRAMFTLSAGAGAVAVACTLPAMLGFFFTFDEDDRPFMMVGCAFLLISVALLLGAYAHYGNLVGTAMDYVRATSPTDPSALNGDIIGDQFEILQYGGLVSFGIATMIFGWLMSRSGSYRRPLVWLSLVVGLTSLLFNVVPVLFTLARLVWAVALGATWFRAGEAEDVGRIESAV